MPVEEGASFGTLIHGTSSQEEAVRLNQCCLRTHVSVGGSSSLVFSGVFLPSLAPTCFSCTRREMMEGEFRSMCC